MGILNEILKELEEQSKNKFDCSNITKPEDITSQCDYKDEFPGGRNDKNLVSCCQGEENYYNYNELKHFYENNFSANDRIRHGNSILESMCECCNKKHFQMTWGEYKECVKVELKKRGLGNTSF